MGRKPNPRPVPTVQTEASVDALLDSSPRTDPVPPDAYLPTGCTLLNLAFSGRANGGIPKGKYVYTVGDSGSLKAQPLDAKVLTPTGWVRMGDLRVGDVLVDPDGGRCSVTGVFPQGVKDVYRVTFCDGASTLCCADHLWLTETPGEKARRLPTVKSTRLIKSQVDGGRRHYIPHVAPVEFERQELPLPPYLLGALLGNGFFGAPGHNSVRISTSDEEIVRRVKFLLPDGHVLKSHSRPNDYTIIASVRGKPNFVLMAVRQLGLAYKKAAEKFIPPAYLRAPVADRIELLRGLMDTDGTAFLTNSCTYSTVSKELAAGVRELVRGLGGRVYTTVDPAPKYTYKGEVRYGKPCYYLNVKIADFNPFHLSRKADRITPTAKRLVRRIVSVELAGAAECQCISVDSARRLYVTDDYIVTHNTWLGLNLFAEAARLPQFDDYSFVFDNPEDGAQMDVARYFGPRTAARIRPPWGTVEDPVYSRTVKQFYFHTFRAISRPCIYLLDSMDALLDDTQDEVFRAEVARYEGGTNKVPGSMGMGKAKTNSQNINRLRQDLRDSGSILVVISQTRNRVGTVPGKTRSGGDALKFYADISPWTRPAGDIVKEYRGKERVIGAEVRVDVQKNRVCGWEDAIIVRHLKATGLDDLGTSVAYLLEEGHWKATSGWFEAPEFGPKKYTVERLIADIEETGREAELAAVVQKVWDDVLVGSALPRKPRYV